MGTTFTKQKGHPANGRIERDSRIQIPHLLKLPPPCKASLEPLGIDGDEAFVQGFRDGMEAVEVFAVNRSTCSPSDAEERARKAWYEGREEGEGDFVKRVDVCHCGQSQCQQFRREHPNSMILQPCHCGADGCLELCTIEPHQDPRLLMHISATSTTNQRTPFWWEEEIR